MDTGPCLFMFGDASHPQVSTVLLPTDNPVKCEDNGLGDISSVCRVCLSTSIHHQLTGDRLSQFTLVTGVIPETVSPGHLCSYCVALLDKCHSFRKSANEADLILKEGATGLHINNFARHSLSVGAKFSSVHFKPNQFDFDIVHDDVKDIDTKLDIDSAVKREFLDADFDAEETKNDIDDNLDENHADSNETDDSDNEPLGKQVKNKLKLTVIRKKVGNAKTKKTKLTKSKDIKLTIKKNKRDADKDGNSEEKNSDPDTEIPKHQSRPATSEDGKYFEEYFTFELLCFKDQVKEWEKRRESRNYLHSPYRCDYCFKGFMCEKTHTHHMTKNHDESAGSESCRVCRSRYPTVKALKRHSRNHIDKFRCKKCTYESSSRSAALLHMRWHREKQYNCSHCSEVFMHRSSLLSHIRLKHPSTDSVCALCGYSFVGANGIACHMRRRHNNEDTKIPADGPRCTECDIRFLKQEALDIHLQVSPKHGLMKRNSPGKIKKAKRTKMAAAAAKNLRLKKREPMTCEKCGIKLTSGREYQRHFLSQHPTEKMPTSANPCLCFICGRLFRTPTVLQDHMTEHAEHCELYKCDTCGKGFRKKSTLSIHKSIHLGKRYPCPLCGKLFNQVNNRDRHYTYVHSNIKDVKCDFCEKFFKSEEDKKLHISHVHFKKPYPKRDRSRKRQIDVPNVRRKRDGYMLDVVEHSWMRDSESSEGSMVN